MNSQKNQAPQVPIVFFDGGCGLCDRAIAYLLASANADRLRYAPQGGNTFEELARQFPDVTTHDSLIVWDRTNGRYFIEATGLALALKQLGGLRGVMGFALSLVPKPIANSVYRWVARNRFRFFPYRGLCSILSEAKRALILP